MTSADYRFVDLSGYAFTGKHAVIDLMREVAGYHVPHFEFEFALLRIQGGILDLHHALCEDWSPIRSDAAIRRFRRLVRRLGTSSSVRSPRSWFTAVGWNYNDYFAGRFFELSDAYVDDLVTTRWEAPWPYALADVGECELFLRKLKSRLRRPRALDFTMVLARPQHFVERTRRYLRDVLSSNVSSGTKGIVMHNAFEPFTPLRAMRFFRSAKAIVVDRDPRDNYAQGQWYAPFASSVDDFVRRYRMQREATDFTPHADVLRIRFEDLVLDYDATVARILTHLGESPSAHVRARQHFDPAVSKKNLGIWRAFPKPDEMARIARALPDFCDARL